MLKGSNGTADGAGAGFAGAVACDVDGAGFRFAQGNDGSFAASAEGAVELRGSGFVEAGGLACAGGGGVTFRFLRAASVPHAQGICQLTVALP